MATAAESIDGDFSQNLAQTFAAPFLGLHHAHCLLSSSTVTRLPFAFCLSLGSIQSQRYRKAVPTVPSFTSSRLENHCLRSVRDGATLSQH